MSIVPPLVEADAWATMPPLQRAPHLRKVGRKLVKLSRRQPGLFSFVYAIQAGEGGPIKIGVSDSPWARLKTLQQANSETLIPLAAWYTLKRVEKELHEIYAYARIRGEWFRPDPDLIELVTWKGGCFCDWENPAKYDPDDPNDPFNQQWPI